MRKSLNNLALLAIAGVAAFSSCSRDMELYNPNATAEEYAKNWEETFGTIDPEQDWNAATQVTANVNLNGLSGAQVVKIYSGSLIDSNSVLMAQYSASTSTFTFDAPKATSMVYAVVEDNSGKKLLDNYFFVKDNVVTISTSTAKQAKTRAEGAATTSVSKTFTSSYATRDANGQDVTCTATFGVLENVAVSHTKSISWSDLKALCGYEGVFPEGTANRDTYSSRLTTDAVYDTNDEGIDITFNAGGTDYYNKLAYYYWKEGEDPSAAVRYVLIDDARPSSNVTISGDKYGYDYNVYPAVYGKVDEWTNEPITTFNSAGTWLTQPAAWGYIGQDYYSHTILNGTTYSLVFFDGEDGPTYTFPKGYKVAFDLISTRSSYFAAEENYLGCSLYSVTSHNAAIHKYYYGNTDAWKGGGEVSAVTYKAGGKVVLGFEDGTDQDMNDFLFVVEGVKDDDIPVLIEDDDPEAQSWIIACEDLGDTDDYDFNDVVVEVKHVSGQPTATITPLAAGGTLASNLYFTESDGNVKDLGEIHSLLGESGTDGSYPMINTSSITNAGTSKTVNVDTNFSLAYNADDNSSMGGFSIKVSDDESAITIMAPAEGDTPMMILVPGTWKWPTERTRINSAYDQFTDWSQSANANVNWYDTVTGNVISR